MGHFCGYLNCLSSVAVAQVMWEDKGNHRTKQN